jgi:hypothetical protein
MVSGLYTLPKDPTSPEAASEGGAPLLQDIPCTASGLNEKTCRKLFGHEPTLVRGLYSPAGPAQHILRYNTKLCDIEPTLVRGLYRPAVSRSSTLVPAAPPLRLAGMP